MRRRAPWLFFFALLGCGTHPRRLPTRIVDDPMVLPRDMILLGLGGNVAERPRPRFSWSVFPIVNFGLRDRLELDSLLSLRWAILDDAPPPAGSDRRPDRVSLAVRGGATGFGVSSTEGLMVFPVVSAELLKHVGAQSLISLSGRWDAEWAERSGLQLAPLSDELRPAGPRQSGMELDAGALRQLGDHVALEVGAGVHQLEACTFPWCGWAARGGQVWMGPRVRPWYWLTLSLDVFAGARYRHPGQPVQAPDAPIAPLPRTVTWLGLAGSAAIHW